MQKSLQVIPTLGVEYQQPALYCQPEQKRPHTPPWHDCPIGQALPQAPQFLASMPRSTSQPFVTSLSQLAKPPLHWPKPHMPFTQIAAAFWITHFFPQAPQLFTSV